jgi:neutral ceramidase
VYRAGWSRSEIVVEPRGYAMHGYGMWHHRARAKQTALYARAVFVTDDGHRALMFCCLDLGYVTHAMRAGVADALRARLGDAFDDAALVLTCTHTHSGPGGCTHDALYNVVTPGFVSAHLDAVIAAGVASILEARERAAPTELGLARSTFDEGTAVAWNRSLSAYNRNPDVTPRRETETHLALNRTMDVLAFRRGGRLEALVSLFGVHATCLGNRLDRHDGDNKGYAAAHAERALAEAGAAHGVAIFAQATAGDVSPHYQGPGDVARRAAIRGDAEYAYAEANGRVQSERALSALARGDERRLDGRIDAIFGYFDFTGIHADARFTGGDPDAWTSDPCHGVAFFRGTRIDGPGLPGPVAIVAESIARAVKARRLNGFPRLPREERAYYRRLYAAQGSKTVLMEAGRKLLLGGPLAKTRLPDFVDPAVKELKRQARLGAIRESALVPTVLPLQIVTVGQLALVCCPGEFTTTAGRRLLQAVDADLRACGATELLICTYCNDYMGYTTTREEYEEQCYEGGHTVFGQWQLAAFQTRFTELARELRKPEPERGHDRTTRPRPVPAGELALRADLPVPGYFKLP